MNKTDVIVRKVQNREGDPIRAIISLTVHTDLGGLAIHDIKIIETRKGRTLIAMPNRRESDGAFRDVAHPVDEATRANLENAVYAAYERFTGQDIRSDAAEDGEEEPKE